MQSIDAANNTVDASSSESFDGESSALLRLCVEPTTRITIDGQEAQLTDLKAGFVVDLHFERSATGIHRALRIEATGETIGGFVVLADNEYMTIEGDADKIERKFELEKTAVSLVDGKVVKLKSLTPKMKVLLYKSFKKAGVHKVEAVGPALVGVVKSVDFKSPAITVTSEERRRRSKKRKASPCRRTRR